MEELEEFPARFPEGTNPSGSEGAQPEPAWLCNLLCLEHKARFRTLEWISLFLFLGLCSELSVFCGGSGSFLGG